jgi:hypothetical protein
MLESEVATEEDAMTISSRRDAVRLLAFGILAAACPATSWARELPPVVQQMAKTYGLDSFSKIDGIRFTFNAELPGIKLPSRSWEWNPKTDTVSYRAKDKDGKTVTAEYPRAQLGSQSDTVKSKIDPAFINDQYWLLLPFHAVWDGSATVTDDGMQKLPLGKGSAERILMKYPSQGGYAPGDTWELYLGPDKRIEEMVYRRGAARKPGVVTVTWSGYKEAGPLLVSTDHRGTADGKPLRVFLTDVSVRSTGSNNWLNAQ